MKTAVSLPDDLFRRAERMAKRLKHTRSELYQRAADDEESEALVAHGRRMLRNVEW